MTFEDRDLQSAVAKLATSFSDAELEALTSYLGDSDDVAGFQWQPDRERDSLLQRIEAHPGFRPLRMGFMPDSKGVVACASPSGD